jgi:hypothetical protein
MGGCRYRQPSDIDGTSNTPSRGKDRFCINRSTPKFTASRQTRERSKLFVAHNQEGNQTANGSSLVRRQVIRTFPPSMRRVSFAVMFEPEEVAVFIEHCQGVYGRTLTEDEAASCLIRLLDLYDLLYRPLPPDAALPDIPDPPPATPGRSPATPKYAGPDQARPSE